MLHQYPQINDDEVDVERNDQRASLEESRNISTSPKLYATCVHAIVAYDNANQKEEGWNDWGHSVENFKTGVRGQEGEVYCE